MTTLPIQELFARDIHRPINGVVKADQRDASAVWQELDEFVVTRELNTHMHALVAVLLKSLQARKGQGAADRNGIWVSGFFGCGKSHFIKVLSYLLENQQHQHLGESRRAVDFFADKLGDPLLYADLKRVVASTTETILFNIDSKADHSSGRDALLQVFLKVLNEKQGYSGDHPHIAHMERHLDERNKLAAFQDAFARHADEPWLEQRDAWEFYRDDVGAALQETMNISEGAAEKWVEGAESNFSLTVENLAKWVKRFLDRQGPEHRLMFLVDEVGQFIGNDTHLMLNLQTITEQLGTVCQGRAWVLVTSQEDLNAVLGDLKSAKQHDFSKIQGRFTTRLSLSSANVDEVIKKRLLDKRESAETPLRAAYEGKHDILRNQLSFINAGMSFDHYADVGEFSACYPFAAYQFRLVQKVFESIRKAGATGLHLSQGERSTLDAFQSAARQLGSAPVGALVPFYAFYPAVEGFLDTAVKRTIDQARDNSSLQPFDNTLLKVLFLIRYIDELPGSVDNLVTLCVEEIDSDRLALRKQIEQSLARLESETLIARNGDLYFFLTNEERDIGREIKNQPVPSGAEEREVGKLLFEDLLGDVRKHTYSLTKKDFAFNRLCDDHAIGHKLEGSLEVAFVSPVGDRFAEFTNDSSCIMQTSVDANRVLIRLPDETSLGRELRTYLQTESYVRTKHTGSLATTTKRILAERSEENRTRRRRLVNLLSEMMRRAAYFACGTQLAVRTSVAGDALKQALEYLIQNAYPKMGYVQHLQSNPKHEIQATLRANDMERVGLGLETADANKKALDDLRTYVDLCARTNRTIVLRELIEKRYGRQPYGWPELEVVLLVAKLAVLKQINLVMDSAPLPLDRAYDHLTSASKQRKVILSQRQVVDRHTMRKAQGLGKELFAKLGPEAEDTLYAFLRDQLRSWQSKLKGHQILATTGNYPGEKAISAGLQTIRPLADEKESKRFLERFVAAENALLDLADDYQDLDGFYRNQKHTWEGLRRALVDVEPNRLQLERHVEAGPALKRMAEILSAERPYGMLREVAKLTAKAKAVDSALAAKAREPALHAIEKVLALVEIDLDKIDAPESVRGPAKSRLEQLQQRVLGAGSIAHIRQHGAEADRAYEAAIAVIEAYQAEEVRRAAAEQARVAEAERLAKELLTGRGGATGGDKSDVPGTQKPEVVALEPVRPKKAPTPPKPVLKTRRVVRVEQLHPKSYLESQEDVDVFLGRLREALEKAIAANERVQVR